MTGMTIKAIIISAILAISPANTRTEIGMVCNECTIETSGNLWDYTTEINPGSFIIITFNTLGTEIIYDDEIISVEAIN